MKKNHPQPNPEDLYAKVNKLHKKQHSPETVEPVYAPQKPPENAYMRPRGGENPQKLVDPYTVTDLLTPHMGPDAHRLENPLYESLDTQRNTGLNPEPPETIYAPQKPPENAYMRPRGGENPQKLVDPYTVTDLLTPHMGPDAYRLENPLYESLDTQRNTGLNPEPPETIYAPQNPPENTYMRPRGGENPQKLVDPYTVTDLLTPHMGPDAYRLENPLYESLDTGRNEERNPELPETVYAPQNPPGNAYMRPREGENPQKLVDPYTVTDLLTPHMGPDAYRLENPLYESLDTGRNEERNPELPETVYAPQNPPGNAYMRPREGENPQKLVDPYTVTDLLTPHMGPDAYRLENPLYAGLNTGRNEERNPEPPETVYASKNPPENAYMRPRGGKNPQKLVDPYKVTDLLKPHMGPDAHHLENPLYESLDTQRNTGLNPEPQESVHKEVNLGRRTPSPETHNIAQNLLRNVDIQYGREEVRYWCGIVYGNRSALEEQFSKILENPQQGETILWDLAENPESGGQLAGRKVLGVKSPKRKEAEEGFGPLCAALERHVGTVKKLHKDLTRHHERDKKHKKEKSLEQKQQRHSHPTREQQQTAPEQNRQPSKQAPSEGRAFAL